MTIAPVAIPGLNTLKIMKNTIYKTVEEFTKLSCSEICLLLRNDKSLSIIGDKLGVDRCIIRKKLTKNG